MKFQLALLAVKDVEISKKFYSDLFEQKVVLDLGWNVTFSGGFAIQQNFAWLTGLSEGDIVEKSNNMELYFEVDDFDEFLEKLHAHPEIKYVHPPKKHEWQQRVVRIYDPDYHMIEVGESMEVIARRYLKDGFTAEETAKIIQHPLEFVKRVQESLK
ncbi:glyoxalase/bleomycin resistance/dioxygenase family protein [Caproiciproducens galactitolivorans]|uniref:Glyoxalase-like domain protein n=1 Tax=Caproiciproducens galactitolivorans TaxID=642589 RepID=A0A4Z0YJI2_9FIRM|nr:VOC family protein [Caproiciproducens galactitolivorans]QEY34428.1 glyoxalase/bleomycin resistance/dioxygenase family protein [Caproiciproducens galactitolivorans]TGJ77796.1 glyoxalase-like domain protein [Caproiciproducens galactitolivorans]